MHVAPMPTTSSSIPPSTTSSKRGKILLALSLTLLIILTVIDAFTTKHIPSIIKSYLHFLQESPSLGTLTIVFIYMIATVLFVPGSVLTLGVSAALGNAFGLFLGLLLSSLAVFVGASIGSTLSFLIARYLLFDKVSEAKRSEAKRSKLCGRPERLELRVI